MAGAVVWVLLAGVCFGVTSVAKGALVNDYTIPGTESQHGIDTLDERFPRRPGRPGQLVFESASGPITDHQAPIEDQITAIEKVKHVSSVDDPFASGPSARSRRTRSSPSPRSSSTCR